MNKQLIRKIINLNETSVPEFAYENPFLDKNVARSFSRSVIKVLTSENSNVNCKLRNFMIENLRKLCRREPEGHVKLNENALDVLLKSYEKLYYGKSLQDDISFRSLEAFLIRTFSHLNINSTYCSFNCEGVQALINMGACCNEQFLKDIIIHLNDKDVQTYSLLCNIWYTLELNDTNLVNDLSMKLKQIIEQDVIDICFEAINTEDQELTSKLLSNKCFNQLVKRSSISSNCFQTCCFILNSLFIRSDFDICLKCIIQVFISNVKITTKPAENFVVLYPKHLQSIVLMLCDDLDLLLPKHYHTVVKPTLEVLHKLSYIDLMMLLSHNQNLFDLYTTKILEVKSAKDFSMINH